MLCLCSCSAPTRPPALEAAARAEASRRPEDALATYQRILAWCNPPRPDCVEAALLYGRLLGRLERLREAVQAYDRCAAMAERLASLPAHALAHPPARVPAHLPAGTQVAAAGASAGTLENGARCLEQAASLRLGPLGEEAAGLAQAWRVVADHGDSAAAHSALRLIVAAGKRQGQTRALYEELVAGARRVAGRAIASELLLLAARVAEADLGQPALAMARLDELAQRYPQSMLRDDALMQAARLARAGGDFAGALSRYQAVQRARPRSPLLRPYEPSVFARAQYEAALVYLEDLKHLPSALAGLEKVRDGFPQSRLRDDAQLAIARVYEQAGDRAKACAALERLRRDFPESSLVNRKAPEMAARLGCGGARVPTRDGGRQ